MCIREGERISQWAAGGGQQILKSPVTTGYQTHPVFSSFDCQVVTRPLKDVCKVLLLYSLAHIWGLSLLPLRLLIPGSRHLTFSPDPSPRLPKGALLSLVTGHSLFFFFFGKFSNFLFVNDFSALCRCPSFIQNSRRPLLGKQCWPHLGGTGRRPGHREVGCKTQVTWQAVAGPGEGPKASPVQCSFQPFTCFFPPPKSL